MARKILTSVTLISFCLLLNSAGAEESHNRMTFFKNAKDMQISSLNIDGVNAYLSDIVSSNDPDAPISCGLFRMEKGKPLEYTYTYDEVKIIIAGEMTISEENGESVHAQAGDVVYFDQDAKITFTSESSGLAFYCGQRALGVL
jgi:ethanolamine utilization protein EutQ (cupin superfamily)